MEQVGAKNLTFMETKKMNREFWRTARIGTLLDKRRKLTDEDKAYIKKLYEVEHLPIREISRIFEGICSRRAIQFVLFPNRDKALKVKVKEEKRWNKYYDKDKHKDYMRAHRQNIREKFGL